MQARRRTVWLLVGGSARSKSGLTVHRALGRRAAHLKLPHQLLQLAGIESDFLSATLQHRHVLMHLARCRIYPISLARHRTISEGHEKDARGRSLTGASRFVLIGDRNLTRAQLGPTLLKRKTRER